MIKYRTWHDTGIEEVEVIRETANFVVEVNGQRWAKRNADFRSYFDTWQEARQFLIDREKTAICKALREMQAHQETLQKIEAMTCQ